MGKARIRFPKVFIGHPFKKRFPVETFRSVFQSLPFVVVYGNTDIETRQLLKILKNHIQSVDYCIFDLTFWNPNVALELGLVEGLKLSPLKNYYILLDSRKSKDVPSDVKGLQRLEYTKYDFSSSGLGNQLLVLLKKESISKKLILKFNSHFENHEKKEKAFLSSMKIMGHLRNFDNLSKDNIPSIFRGTRFQQKDRDKIFEIMVNMKILTIKDNKYCLKSKKSIFG